MSFPFAPTGTVPLAGLPLSPPVLVAPALPPSPEPHAARMPPVAAAPAAMLVVARNLRRLTAYPGNSDSPITHTLPLEQVMTINLPQPQARQLHRIYRHSTESPIDHYRHCASKGNEGRARCHRAAPAWTSRNLGGDPRALQTLRPNEPTIQPKGSSRQFFGLLRTPPRGQPVASSRWSLKDATVDETAVSMGIRSMLEAPTKPWASVSR